MSKAVKLRDAGETPASLTRGQQLRAYDEVELGDADDVSTLYTPSSSNSSSSKRSKSSKSSKISNSIEGMRGPMQKCEGPAWTVKHSRGE